METGIYVVRAFVQLRQASTVHANLVKRLMELELSTERELSHDTLSRNTRNQLRKVFDAPRELADKVTSVEQRIHRNGYRVYDA